MPFVICSSVSEALFALSFNLTPQSGARFARPITYYYSFQHSNTFNFSLMEKEDWRKMGKQELYVSVHYLESLTLL